MIANILALYLGCACLLAFYSPEVSSVLAGVGRYTMLKCWLLVVSLSIVFRVLLLTLNRKRLTTTFLQDESSFLTLPFTEFRSDVMLWALNGLFTSAFMGIFYGITLQSGLEMTFACIACGVLVGVLSCLDMEREVMNFAQKQRDITLVGSNRPLLPIASKFFFLLVTVMIVSGFIIGFMAIDDFRSLKERGALSNAASYDELVCEVGLVTIVMLLFSVAIIRKFSRNLNMLFRMQIETLVQVEHGRYDVRVPVTSADEFGIIAAQTNGMILGLEQREFIRDSFGRYVTKEVRDLILSNRIPLTGETKNVTIMFCDIRGFTSHVSSGQAVEVVKRLNEYFTEMSKAIEDRHGLVLQFIGDEIEAVFGAPQPLENHAEMAVMAALDMRNRLAKLNQDWTQSGRVPWKHGMGIHTGNVLAGNIGSPDRLSYLMVGDTVNLASRIQELTKKYDCDILISAQTRTALRSNEAVQHVGSETARGMSVETDLFKVL